MPNPRKPKTIEEAHDQLAAADGDLQRSLAKGLHQKGKLLALREKYRDTDGIDAVHLYLVTKYGWLPSVVRGMSYADLDFVLSEEKFR